MNYFKIYNSIIENSKTRSLEDFIYVERHHIVPKCLSGDNSKNNIAVLTYREHFICHWILCKLHPSNFKLKSAFAKMLGKSHEKTRIISSKEYSAVKRVLKGVNYPWLHKKEPWNKGKKDVQVPWNKGIKTGSMDESVKNKISETLKERFLTHEHPRKGKGNWCQGTKGLVIPWNKGIEEPKYQCIHCLGMFNPGNLKRWHGEKCKQKRI